MFDAGVLTFREFMMGEPLPLATLQQAILEFLRGRDDAVVFGAQAVNAYVSEPRMSQYLDLLSPQADIVARELCAHLRTRFHIAVRIRRVDGGKGLRVYQLRKSGNRHLVDLRSIETLPPAKRIAGVLVLAPAELIASKVMAYHNRRGQPKSGADWRDLAMLLLAFPELKRDPGPVGERLRAVAVDSEVIAAWQTLVAQEIRATGENEEF